jgi:hypothetical protein
LSSPTHPARHYTDRGRYGSQLRHLLRHFPREQVLLLRYRDLRDDPRGTVDRVCGFLGVATGLVGEAPPRERAPLRRRHAGQRGPAPAAAGRWQDRSSVIGHRFPVPVRRAFSRPLLALLHRRPGRRPRVTPEQRAALLPRFVEEIELLQEVSGESYADWLSLDHASNFH